MPEASQAQRPSLYRKLRADIEALAEAFFKLLERTALVAGLTPCSSASATKPSTAPSASASKSPGGPRLRCSDCRHSVRWTLADLARFPPQTPLAEIAARLTCSTCGGHDGRVGLFNARSHPGYA